jgi:hypothetical protein
MPAQRWAVKLNPDIHSRFRERRYIAMRKTILALLLASSATALSLPAAAEIYVNIAPPAPRYEVVPAPRSGYVWVPGYWDWRGNHNVWAKGHRERERHGMYWHPNRWTESNGHYILERGRWDKERFVENHRGYGDRDHDGVPNRYDRAPDNPYRQ